jgi:hypothetical protein
MEHTMRNILSTTVAGLAAIGLAGGAASAQAVRSDESREVARADWMSVGEVATMLEGQGYTVRGIEIDDGAYEVTANDAKGTRVEADLDPSTGEPLRGWRQDD